jgi:S-DNA-T family DNA segregation ATPase FtsK/SpoIIIE
MAKKQNTKKTTRKSKDVQASVLPTEGFSKKELVGFSIGILLFVFAFFLLAAFTSYIYSGSRDFDILENPVPSDIANPVDAPVFENVCGSLGAKVAYFFLNETFGLAAYIIPLFMVMLGMKLMKVYKVRIVRWFILLSLLVVWTSVFLAAVTSMIPVFDNSFINPGGNHGKFVVNWLTSLVGRPGVMGVLLLFAVFYLLYISKKTIDVIRSLFRLGVYKKMKAKFERESSLDETNDMVIETQPDPAEFNNPEAQVLDFNLGGETALKDEVKIFEDEVSVVEESVEKKEKNDKKRATDEINIEIEKVGEVETADGSLVPGGLDTPYDPKLDLENYKYPTLSLLDKNDSSSPMIDMVEQKANKDRIINVLRSFGVEISSIKATIGPTITLYEITPAEGTRINKIRNLEDDIALSLAAEGIRIIAPIPGKGTIGIEVPNKKKCIVSMESILNSKTYQETTMDLPCALGKTITNEVFMVDLAKAPHMLVAGATGMGKSVGLNAIVTSLLYKKHPSELKIVMVDPKKVEFSIYSPIENHFLAKLEEEDEAIITDVQRVVKTLNSLCAMMDTRYDLLKKAKVRNIKEYNEKFKKRELNPENGHEFMPYVVVIIDEFGDLIMTAGKEIELPICRIAQLARAVGIHMIIATQRPTTNIITGTIKANFPARIAFRVAAMMDSRTILDRPGANQLIGRGDMLYLQGADPVRVQCAFVDTPEVSRICKYISQQQGYLHAMYLPEVVADEEPLSENTADMKHLDPMFDDVAKLVVSTQQGSTSFIQRKLSIGYNRAGRLMDQLEKAGIVGQQIGSKPREVLIQDPLTLESVLNTLHM